MPARGCFRSDGQASVQARRARALKQPPQLQGGREPDRYRPGNLRRRVLVALLALATVAAVAALMLRPHQLLMGAKAARADAQRAVDCPPGAASATPGCPGGRMDVMVLPAAPAGTR